MNQVFAVCLQRIKGCLGLFLLALAPMVNAATVENLYTVSLPVLSQDQTDRLIGFEQALEKVLIKVAGDQEAIRASGVSAAFSKAATLVQTFSYRENPAYQPAPPEVPVVSATAASVDPNDIATSPLGTESGTPGLEEGVDQPQPEIVLEPFLLEVSFAKASVDALLSDYSLPIWGKERPGSMLWIVSEDQGERTLLSAQDQAMVNPLFEVSEALGLPIFLPAVDLEDQVLVDLNDLWGLYPSSIERAESRYQPDVSVLVKLSTFETTTPPEATDALDSSAALTMLPQRRYAAEWVKVTKGELVPASAEADSIESLWEMVLADVSAKLARRFAVLEGAEFIQRGLQIEVSNVMNFTDYAELGRYLDELPVLKESNTVWVQGDTIAFQVDLKGGRDRFLEFVEIGGRLKHVKQNALFDLRTPNLGLEPEQETISTSSGTFYENFSTEVLVQDAQRQLSVPEKFVWLGQ